MLKHKVIPIILILAIILTMFWGCTPKLKRYEASFIELFDTVTMMIGYSTSQEEFTKVAADVKTQMEEYHQLYDIYNDYDNINNIKTINDNAGVEPVKVDEKIIDLLEFGVDVYNQTKGLTNMAMGSVLRIWHDYRTLAIANPDRAELPPMAELEKASQHMNINDVVINRDEGTVFLKDEEMSLDVGSLAKGYAVEMVAQNLESQGVDHFIISAGGNVRGIGTRGDGSDWRVGVENPYRGSESLGLVKVESNSFVTSGTYQRFYEYEGQRYHHIINPETLMPESNFAAVAVLVKDSGLADGLSTAIFNMTLEEGKAFVEAYDGLEAMWMMPDESIIYSTGFEENLI